MKGWAKSKRWTWGRACPRCACSPQTLSRQRGAERSQMIEAAAAASLLPAPSLPLGLCRDHLLGFPQPFAAPLTHAPCAFASSPAWHGVRGSAVPQPCPPACPMVLGSAGGSDTRVDAGASSIWHTHGHPCVTHALPPPPACPQKPGRLVPRRRGRLGREGRGGNKGTQPALAAARPPNPLQEVISEVMEAVEQRRCV